MPNANIELFETVVRNRRSIRAFTQQQVPDETLHRIFNLAQQAPSNCNTQPWKVAVVSGERCRALAARISNAMTAGDIAPDFPYDGIYHGEYRERQHQAAADLYTAMGIDREDKIGRSTAFMRNFSFFDAPHAAFLFLREESGIREAVDLGMYAQTLMLALSAHGLGSCPQTSLSYQAHIVRKELGISDAHKLLFGISFGYPDWSHSSNRCQTSRAEIDQVVDFIY